jgi:hypothetical protein
MMKKPLFEDDEPFYINEQGLYVFTADYLLKRGYCCGNGCLHCPYNYKNVLDPEKKKRLIEQQTIHDKQK